MRNLMDRGSSTPECFLTPPPEGRCALFVVETRSSKEEKLARSIFDNVGRLTSVVTVSHGQIMSFAVVVTDDASLFTKIECLLKSYFSFSLIEPSLTEGTIRMVETLCEDSDSQMVELPQCCECHASDPFPLRAKRVGSDPETAPLLTFCRRCSTPKAGETLNRHVQALVKRQGRRVPVKQEAVTETAVEEAPQERLAAVG